jgi:hypothetical protein
MKYKQYEQLLRIKTLGINVEDKDYEQVVDILIERFLDLLDEVEATERERFRRDLKRIQKPTN